MTDDDSMLEAELLALAPKRPSPELKARIARALADAPEARPHRRGWLAWLSVPLAAAAIFTLVLLNPDREAPPPQATAAVGAAASSKAAPVGTAPVSTRNVVWRVTDGGYVQLADGLSGHRYYRLSTEVLTWRDASMRGQVQWVLPREDVCVLPLQAY